MPNPTRQEFDAIAKHVMETAPAGLSRDQFFALIDKEVAKPLDSVNNAPDPEAEPDTFGGGFLRSLKKDFLGASVNNSLTQGAAHPKDLGDFLGLLLPAGYRAGGLAKESAESGIAAAKGAQPGMLNRVRGFWRGVGQDIQGKPTSVARDEMLLNDGAKAPAAAAAAPAAERDLYSAYKAKPTPAVPPRVYKPGTAPPSTGVPTLEDNISDSITALLKESDDSRITSLPPEQGITPGGTTRQSGSFPKRNSVGQAGGYTSGRPAVTPQQYDEVVESAAATPKPAPYTPPAAPEPPPPVQEPALPFDTRMSIGGQTIKEGHPAYDSFKEALMRDGIEPPPTSTPPAPADVVKPAADDAMSQKLQEMFGGKGLDVPPPVAQEATAAGGGPLSQPRVTRINPDKLTPELWSELRRFHGAEELARLTGKSVEEVKALAPGPSTLPLEVEDRINQNPDGLFKFLRQ